MTGENKDTQNSQSLHDELEYVKSAKKLEYKTKVYLALADSNNDDFGMVIDTFGDIAWTQASGKGEIVGIWCKSRVDNLIHISLLPSIEALYDRAVQTWKRYCDEKNVVKVPQKKARVSRKESKDKEAQGSSDTADVAAPYSAPTISDEDKLAMNSMRERIMRLRTRK